jgi:hypothetical protein
LLISKTIKTVLEWDIHQFTRRPFLTAFFLADWRIAIPIASLPATPFVGEQLVGSHFILHLEKCD